MPLIQKAADSVLEKDIIENGKHDVKEIASRYTIKAIMSSAFSIGTFKIGHTIITCKLTKIVFLRSKR